MTAHIHPMPKHFQRQPRLTILTRNQAALAWFSLHSHMYEWKEEGYLS